MRDGAGHGCTSEARLSVLSGLSSCLCRMVWEMKIVRKKHGKGG